MTKTYYEAVKMLSDLFDQFNDYLFNGEVEKPVITIMHDITRSAYGWCTTQKIWQAGEEKYYEINVCAEYLNRPIKNICATLIHEMVHLYNIKKGIKDTSGNGRYHNKKFKETAEAHGLTIEQIVGYGWTKTSLQEETATWIDQNVEIENFDLVRLGARKSIGISGTSGGNDSGDEGNDSGENPTSKKSKYNYYACPCCGKKFYSIYKINATCDDCDAEFEQYK